MKKFLLSFLTLGVAGFLSTSAIAQTTPATANGVFNFQGSLSNANGTAVSDGSHSLVAKVYTAGSSSVVYSEQQTVTTSGGVFTTIIGANGAGSSQLNVDASKDYELGVSIDGGAELMPHIPLTGTLKAATADVAMDAKTIGGYAVSSANDAKANTIVALNNAGKFSGSLIDSGVVHSINGLSGAVKFVGAGDLSITRVGDSLKFGYIGAGGMTFPFTKSLSLATGSAFSITNDLGASAASFSNTNFGNAIDASSAIGSAINARSNGTTTGAATISAINSGGTAINAVATSTTNAVVSIKNMAFDSSAKLIEGLNAAGTATFNLAASGKTTINSSVDNALDVTSNVIGGTALKLVGGLKLAGPVGTGQILISQTSTTINNVYAKANSIIMITLTGAGGTTVPLQVASQANGSFVVSVLTNALAVTGNVTFSYMIINQ